ARVAAMKNKRGFIQRPAGLNRLLGLGDDFVGIDDSGRDHDAAGEKLSRQLANFRALIKDGLRRFVESGDLVFGVVAKPNQLLTLQTHQIGGFGNILLAWFHWLRCTSVSKLGESSTYFPKTCNPC